MVSTPIPVGSRSMLKTREGDTMKLIKASVRRKVRLRRFVPTGL